MWLIITDTHITGIIHETVHSYTYTSADIDMLRIINPSKLALLLKKWCRLPIQEIHLILKSNWVHEQYNATKIPSGFVAYTCMLSEGSSYTAAIPGILFIHYCCFFKTLGITLKTITTATAVSHYPNTWPFVYTYIENL